MIEVPFTIKSIKKAIIYDDLLKDGNFYNVDYRLLVSNETCSKIEQGNIFLESLNISKINGKNIYQYPNFHQKLAARVIGKNLKANYRIEQNNRHNLIKNVLSILHESNPYSVHRFDIVKFFESVDIKELYLKLLNDGRCSRQTMTLLNEFFNQLKRQNIDGLPRGIGLSSILSEYILLDFDRRIKEDEEIFFYGRFVDDIILITSNSKSQQDILNLVKSHLPPPLEIHTTGSKVTSLVFPKTSTSKDNSKSFEYLGYKFTVCSKLHPSLKILGNGLRDVKLEISDSKIKKIQMRLIQSFVKYISSKQPNKFFTLKNRLKALTGNYHITDPNTGVKIKTGIYFNYSHKNSFIKCEIKNLDNFLRGLLFSKSSNLSKRISNSLSHSQKNELKGFSFHKGFHNKVFHSITKKELNEIKRGWNV